MCSSAATDACLEQKPCCLLTTTECLHLHPCCGVHTKRVFCDRWRRWIWRGLCTRASNQLGWNLQTTQPSAPGWLRRCCQDSAQPQLRYTAGNNTCIRPAANNMVKSLWQCSGSHMCMLRKLLVCSAKINRYPTHACAASASAACLQCAQLLSMRSVRCQCRRTVSLSHSCHQMLSLC